MATTEAQDASAKERIIRHMNADHADSIRRYVEHFEGASFLQSRNARMTDVSLTEMKISYGGKQAIIPFDPPMKTMRESRERLVKMDTDARTALGRSSITVTTYISPYVHLGHLWNFSQCLITYIVFCRCAHFRPGSWMFDHFLYIWPRFAQFGLAIQPYLFWIMVSIHAFETLLMAKKLRKHGASPFNRVWWLWMGSCFVEGVTSFWRMDKWIGEKREEKAAKKH